MPDAPLGGHRESPRVGRRGSCSQWTVAAHCEDRVGTLHVPVFHSTNSIMSKKSKAPPVDAALVGSETPSDTPVIASEEKKSKKRKRDRPNEESAIVTPAAEDTVDTTESSEKKKKKKKQHNPDAIDEVVPLQPLQPTLDEASEKALRKKEKKEKKKKDKTAAVVTTNGEHNQVRSILSWMTGALKLMGSSRPPPPPPLPPVPPTPKRKPIWKLTTSPSTPLIPRSPLLSLSINSTSLPNFVNVYKISNNLLRSKLVHGQLCSLVTMSLA